MTIIARPCDFFSIRSIKHLRVSVLSANIVRFTYSINYDVEKRATRNCEDARIAAPHHPLESAVDDHPHLGGDPQPRMVEPHGFLSDLPSQFYGHRQ